MRIFIFPPKTWQKNNCYDCKSVKNFSYAPSRVGTTIGGDGWYARCSFALLALASVPPGTPSYAVWKEFINFSLVFEHLFLGCSLPVQKFNLQDYIARLTFMNLGLNNTQVCYNIFTPIFPFTYCF